MFRSWLEFHHTSNLLFLKLLNLTFNSFVLLCCVKITSLVSSLFLVALILFGTTNVKPLKKRFFYVFLWLMRCLNSCRSNTGDLTEDRADLVEFPSLYLLGLPCICSGCPLEVSKHHSACWN